MSTDVSLTEMDSALAGLRSRFAQGKGQLELLQGQLATRQTELTEAQEDIQIWQLTQALLAKSAEYARAQLVARIEETVTAALRAVFVDDNLNFKVVMGTLGGQPSASWSVVSRYGDKVVAASPEDARGGGIVDVVSLALRLSLLELARPPVQGPVVLDEPGKMLSREYLPNLAEFLKKYAEATGRQIVLVTHWEQLAEAADVSYRVSQKDGISEVSKA